MKVQGLTFSSEILAETRKRFADQMRSNPLFSTVFEWGEEDLDPEFRAAHVTLLQPQIRGQGQWIWKPYCILQALSKMEQGDLLVQGDAGNSISTDASECWVEFQIAQNDPLGILAEDQEFPANMYTKMDLFHALGMDPMSEGFVNSVEANRIVMEKRPSTVAFVERWLSLCIQDHQHLLDDSPSIAPNLPFFDEHRHDQSIFTLLFSKEGGVPMQFSSQKATRIRTDAQNATVKQMIQIRGQTS